MNLKATKTEHSKESFNNKKATQNEWLFSFITTLVNIELIKCVGISIPLTDPSGYLKSVKNQSIVKLEAASYRNIKDIRRTEQKKIINLSIDNIGASLQHLSVIITLESILSYF